MSMPARLRRSLPFVLGLGLVLVTGFVHGDFTNRWRKSNELQTMIERLGRVPLVCGDWVGSERPRDDIMVRQFDRAQIEGSVLRTYKNRRTGAAVDIMLVCGPVGPIVGHSPQACYTGNGYTLAKTGGYKQPPNASMPHGAEFAVGDFVKNGAVIQTGLRIFWTFGLRGVWSSPAKPRFKFAAERSIYKLYVIRPAVFSEDSLDEDPAIDFIAAFTAAVQPILF